MTLGNSILVKRCDICNAVLMEGEKDIHELSKPYEIPYEIKWNGTNCSITNKVVRHICGFCLDKIMETMQDLMVLGE